MLAERTFLWIVGCDEQRFAPVQGFNNYLSQFRTVRDTEITSP
jgi:hypothetical protein